MQRLVDLLNIYASSPFAYAFATDRATIVQSSRTATYRPILVGHALCIFSVHHTLMQHPSCSVDGKVRCTEAVRSLLRGGSGKDIRGKLSRRIGLGFICILGKGMGLLARLIKKLCESAVDIRWSGLMQVRRASGCRWTTY